MSAFPVHLVEDKAEPVFTALTDLDLVFCTKINFNGEIADVFFPSRDNPAAETLHAPVARL